MSTDQYVFKPKSEVADWIDENIPSWTSFCYDNIYRMQRKNYQNRFERLGLRIFFILIGMILVAFSSMTLLILPFLFLITGGITIIIFGFIMLSLEVRNNGRRRIR